jgi:hypothetical protein
MSHIMAKFGTLKPNYESLRVCFLLNLWLIRIKIIEICPKIA